MLEIYFMAAFGLAYIIGHSYVTLPFRKFLGGTPAKFGPDEKGEVREVEPAKPGALGPFGDFLCVLLECPACLGFWIGVGATFIGVIPPVGNPVIWPIFIGCATAGANYAISRLTKLI